MIASTDAIAKMTRKGAAITPKITRATRPGEGIMSRKAASDARVQLTGAADTSRDAPGTPSTGSQRLPF
jgi:hypothetical protein